MDEPEGESPSQVSVRREEEYELEAEVERWASNEVRVRFSEYQATHSDMAVNRLWEQIRKELRRWTPIRTLLSIALAVVLAAVISFASYYTLKYYVLPIVTGQKTQPVAVGKSFGPTGTRVTIQLPADPVSSTIRSGGRKEPHQRPASPAALPTSEPATTAAATPSAMCTSCSAPAGSSVASRTVQAVQGVLNSVRKIPPELIKPIGQLISGLLQAPGAGASANPYGGSPGPAEP